MRCGGVMHKYLMEQFEVKGVKLVSSVFQARRRLGGRRELEG